MERIIFQTALANMDYNPFAAYRLAHARLASLRARGIKARTVYGVPKAWR